MAAVAQAIREVDAYDHPIAAHLAAERPIPSHDQDEDWLGFTLNQHGHGDVDLDAAGYTRHLTATRDDHSSKERACTEA